MAHEHHGDCCNQHEHHAAEKVQHLALSMGSLCCSGHCHHSEHQTIAAQFEHERSQELVVTQSETSTTTLEKATAKRKKKKAARLFGQLLSPAV